MTKPESAGERREQTLARAKGLCDLCGKPILNQYPPWAEHHAAFRSQAWKGIRDEPWNRMALHRECHLLAHKDRAARDKLLAKAIVLLVDDLIARGLLGEVGKYQRGEVPMSLIRAYETWAKKQR